MKQLEMEDNSAPTGDASPRAMDLVCFSHLRWDFVYQRPHHLMSRFARERRVFYIEEPRVRPGHNHLEVRADDSGVTIAIPYLSSELSKEAGREKHQNLIEGLLADQFASQYVVWYYTPMAVAYTQGLRPQLIVYDCMDELSAFNGAPPAMTAREAELLEMADLVLTGGRSLFAARRRRHPNVHLFPSAIDVAHFATAREQPPDPEDQKEIPHPRLGYFGVIDERMDLDLIAEIADRCRHWHLVMIGPVAKVVPDKLPQRDNIHYLGRKPYQQLPAYLAGWDVALLPFALSKATRFVSPTKTPEYLAGGKPVVSTSIRDVVDTYGKNGLVSIADGADAFRKAVEQAFQLNEHKREWLDRVDEFLSRNSWDDTWSKMARLLELELHKKSNGEPHSSEVAQPISLSPSLPDSLVANKDGWKRRNGGIKKFDYLIVGAGFAGSILAERLARGSGKRVLIIDKRSHIAGNAYDYHNQDGLLVHKYGPHIFHTNSTEVFSYLSQFTAWRPYEHRVLASVDGQLLPIPINLDTVNRLYGCNMDSFELEKFFESAAEPVAKIRTSEDVVVSKIGRGLYEKFFRNYTRKHWGLDPSELDASVTSRVPIRLNRDDRYFTDLIQAMPRYGYTRMFENILDHPNIKIMLNTDYKDIGALIPFRQLIYTGPVDEFFDFRYGKLPYRSLRFEFVTLDMCQAQPVAVINYPNEHLYTRATEFKHLTGQEHPKTTLVYEYPCGEGDPYYPVPKPENAELYKQYHQLALSVPEVHFAGRLGTYKYYNMDQVTAQALTLYARITGKSRAEAIKAYDPASFMLDMPSHMLVSQSLDQKGANR